MKHLIEQIKALKKNSTGSALSRAVKPYTARTGDLQSAYEDGLKYGYATARAVQGHTDVELTIKQSNVQDGEGFKLTPHIKAEIAANITIESRSKTDVVQDVFDELRPYLRTTPNNKD